MLINYTTKQIENTDGVLLTFLYRTFLGRILLKPLVQPVVSNWVGHLLNNRCSVVLIPLFIKKNQIDLSDYVPRKYVSFNDFFLREVRKNCRPFPKKSDYFIPSPCDGKVTAYPITNNSEFTIKNVSYNLKELVQNHQLSEEYVGGTLVLLRLTPDDYHHYCFIDDGNIVDHWRINGVLHTVRPISAQKKKVYIHNSREVTIMNTRQYGKIVQIEVGALLVGKIVNIHSQNDFKCGQSKGHFEFGGSTIILLFSKNSVDILPELLKNTQENRETIIKMGQPIGQGREEFYA